MTPSEHEREKQTNKQRKSTPQLAWLQGSEKSSTALKQLEPEKELQLSMPVKQKSKRHAQDQLKQKWEDKPMHG